MRVKAKRQQRLLRLIEHNLRATVEAGLSRLRIRNQAYDGVTLDVEGQSLINFGSCAYLGLDVDPRLKAGAIDAIERYGPAYSSSAVYTAIPLYDELEDLMRRMLSARVIAMPTTTLSHFAFFQVGFRPGDVILADQQVHATVQLAGQILKASGHSIQFLDHGDMTKLETEVARASEVAERVLYLADGVYSMYGDVIDMSVLDDLMQRYPKLHVYLDDAHGISWAGPHGCGHVLAKRKLSGRMIVAGSLAKGFGSGGAFLAVPDHKTEEMIRTTSGTMIFSGPIHPAQLGASIASTRIHLSPELAQRQDDLAKRIALANRLLEDHELPSPAKSNSPIFFVRVGQVENAIKVASRLKAAGFFANIATFPAVPLGSAGVRFALTLHHSLEQIEAMIKALATARHVVGVDLGRG